nr:unnamed protein product [uncultured bacterium]
MEFKEQIRQIKSDFFSLRNGEIADTLRKAGNPYKIIFGLQMPQLEQIAAKSGKSVELAEWMWANDSTRESKMFATMVYPIEEFDLAKAEEWALEAESFELIDTLCFRLVRYINGSEELVHKYIESTEKKMRYFAFRLALNLLILRKIFLCLTISALPPFLLYAAFFNSTLAERLVAYTAIRLHADRLLVRKILFLPSGLDIPSLRQLRQ